MLHYITLATRLLQIVLFHEDITQQDQKNPALCIQVIKAYTKFQQCRCINFEDMNIFLSTIFIFRGLILLLVAETSEQHRYLVMMIIIPNIGFMVLKTTDLNPVFQCKNQFWKLFTKSWDIGKNVRFRFKIYYCRKVDTVKLRTHWAKSKIIMFLGCSEISATSYKIRPRKMKIVLRKMFISSKVMQRYC